MTIKSNMNVENAKIGFRNFSGKEGEYNPKGRRTFSIFFEPDVAQSLLEDGWNIKLLKPRNSEDDPQHHLQVGVNFNNYPPKIVLIKGNTKASLIEEDVNILDWAEIVNVDLIIRPYNWEVQNRTGVRAYLKTMYVTIAQDEFEEKYKNVPDSAYNSLPDDTPPWEG